MMTMVQITNKAGHEVTHKLASVQYSSTSLLPILVVCKETQHTSVSVVNTTYINGDLTTDNVHVYTKSLTRWTFGGYWCLWAAAVLCTAQ